MKKNVKKRHWAAVLYPESAPENWRELLSQSGLPVAISPLHDKDLDPTGEPKKPHYHLILCYSGPTTFNAVNAFLDRLNQPIPQPLESVRGYYRYLTHKDNPDKHQYSEDEITVINGFNILDFVEMTGREIDEIKIRILDLVRQLEIYEYCDLLDYLRDNEMFAELRIASTHTLFLNSYIKSRKFKNRSGVNDE